MKKLLLSLLVIVGSATIFSSCNQVLDEIKKNINPFDFTADEMTFTLPSSIPSGDEYNSGNQTYDLNINQIIEDNVSVANIDIDDISKITINKVTLHLDGTDAENNWTNFESAIVTANTDKGKTAGKADLVSTTNIGNIESERFNDKTLTFADHNLKDYVDGDGTKIMYSVKAKARKDIKKELKLIATVEYTFKP